MKLWWRQVRFVVAPVIVNSTLVDLLYRLILVLTTFTTDLHKKEKEYILIVIQDPVSNSDQ
jgi:hypothetical protein